MKKFYDVVPGDVLMLSSGVGTFTALTTPETDPLTGALFITGVMSDGSESVWYAEDESGVTVDAHLSTG